ncbi:MAG: winged helix-turn-helix domain-containing protein [Candidatus Helarchaeota archaeon]
MSKDSKKKQNLSLDLILQQKDLVEKLVKPKIRLIIFLILYLYSELNVTQISKLIKKNKTTVSRHLKEMEKDGIVVSREIQARGKINPKNYRLNDQKLFYDIDQHKKVDLLTILDPKSRLQRYKQGIYLASNLFNIIKNGFDLFQPLIESLENNFDEIEKADKEIGLKFFYPTLKVNFDPILISEERLPEANKLYIEYREKLIKLRDKGEKNDEQKSMIVLHTLIPLKDILTLDFLTEEESS